MIAIIDYKLGNIASLTTALQRLGLRAHLDYVVTNDAAIIQRADRVILPGVGRARPAMAELTRLGLDQVIKKLTVPVLGICLGMQLLAQWSEEDDTQCLGCIPTTVKRFQSDRLSIPQIGWNIIEQRQADSLFNLIPNNSSMYFVNSYYMEIGSWTVGVTQYSQSATTVVRWRNFTGVQFHPEKSGAAGLQLLKNFCTDGFRKWWAIDVLNGKCVRLQQGDFTAVTEYATDPVLAARQLVDLGADGIHVIDLDAAQTGRPVHQAVIQKIMTAVSVPVQVGGGIRSAVAAKLYLDMGAQRVIVGTMAFTQPDVVRQLIRAYGAEKILVGLDIKDGQPAIRGWQRTIELGVEEAVKHLVQLGVRTLVVTDVSRDGMLNGPNLELVQCILATGMQVVVAGGISSTTDIERCRLAGAVGVVSGKAVYEGKLLTLSKRIIPCMDIVAGRVVKGTNFVELKDVGDPVALAKLYAEQGADELVFLDIMATVENRDTFYSLVRAVAREIDIPFTVGGGVNTLNDIDRLLKSGADKVSIGSAAVNDPDFLQIAAQRFGAQCIVISVDAKWNLQKRIWEIYSNGGRIHTGIDVVDFGQQMERLGAGELLVNSLDRDGTKQGYDLGLLQAVKQVVSLPVIASSGAGCVQDFIDVFQQVNVDAVLAAGLFHRQEVSIPEVKQALAAQGITIRRNN